MVQNYDLLMDDDDIEHLGTRWAPSPVINGGYNSYKWPYTWVL